MSSRPLVVITDHLAEAGVELAVLDSIAEIQLLQTNDEADVTKTSRRRCGTVGLPRYSTLGINHRQFDALPGHRPLRRWLRQRGHSRRRRAGNRCLQCSRLRNRGGGGPCTRDVTCVGATAIADGCRDSLRKMGCDDDLRGARLRGRTLGIIGCGRIGTAMALRAKALGMDVVFYDPYQPPGLEKALGLRRAYRLDDLLRRAEFLSLHCPLTPETHHILNSETLARLPTGAYVINTARGPCVDGSALLAALDNGRVAFAALDVVEREPLDDEALRRHPHLLLSPHAAFYSVEGFVEMRTKGAEEVRRLLTGEPVFNPVNRPFLVNPRAVLPPARTP